MDGVGSGLGDHVYVGTRIASVSGIILRCLDLELLKRIRIRDTETHEAVCISRVPRGLENSQCSPRPSGNCSR